MSWRKELVLSDRTLEGKKEILRRKSGQRDHFFVLTLIFSFLGFFILFLLLILFNLLGRFPKSAVLAILGWIAIIYLIHYLIKGIRSFLLRRDKKIWELIEFDEEIKEKIRRSK